MMHIFTLKILGPFGLFTADGRRIEISGRKAKALLAFLALAPDGVRTRNWLRTMLWGNRGEPQAQASLRRELSNLITLLEAEGAGGLVSRDAERIQLHLDKVAVDALLHASGLDRTTLVTPGELLEGMDPRDSGAFRQWLQDQRERLSAIAAISSTAVASVTVSAEHILGAALPAPVELIGNMPPGVPPKPSIVVLPFAGASDSGDERLLGTGIAEEIGLSLCGYPQLFVVATGAAEALMQRQVPLTEIGERLGVRYLLDGRVTRNGDALRILVRLLRASDAVQLWTYSTNGSMADIFALQERTSAAVAPQILSTIDTIERANSVAHTPRSSDSYLLFWRANAVFRDWTPASVKEAIALCDELLAREPNSEWGASLAAFCHAVAYRMRLTDDPQAHLLSFLRHRQTALANGSDNIHVLGYLAGALVMIGGDMAVADRLISRALTINLASQPTLFWGGWVDLVTGDPARAIERFELSLRINPASGVRAYAITGIGIALLFDGRDADAYAMLSDAILYIAHYPVTLAAFCVAAARVGEMDAARRAAQSLKDNGLDEQVITMMQNPAHQALLKDGMVLALQG